MKKILTPKFLFVTVAILAAAMSRLLPHPPNFTPIVAVALFGGAMFDKKYMALVIPVGAMILADLFLGGHDTIWSVYLSIVLIAGIGMLLHNKVKLSNTIAASLGSSILFFLITNFAVWSAYDYYPQNFGGLLECYTAAIPFFRNALAGDLVYTAVLFGGYYFASKKFPTLAPIQISK